QAEPPLAAGGAAVAGDRGAAPVQAHVAGVAAALAHAGRRLPAFAARLVHASTVGRPRRWGEFSAGRRPVAGAAGEAARGQRQAAGVALHPVALEAAARLA